MNNANVVYTNNGILFSLKKKKEILPFVTTWVNLKDIMLSQKDKGYVISLICEIKKKKKTKLIDRENRLVMGKNRCREPKGTGFQL